ncbi:MAG: HAMP domain-containing protein, partial [Treponema sp.]|nr:HAMP domain-containing protein [Treponema sp.]
MKIRAKLSVGFFIVVAIGLFLGALGLYIDRKLVSLSEDTLFLADTRTSISSILNAHYVWRHNLSETVYTNAPFTGSIDPETCALGSWLKSDDAKKLTDPEFTSLLSQIIGPHETIHEKAGEIVSHLANGETDEAVKIFKEVVLPNTLNVINILGKMQDRYGALLEGKINEIHSTGVVFERIILIAIITSLIISILLTIIITSIIVRPIVKVADVLKIAATGDLTSSINIKTKDEMGNLARDFNFTIGKIKELVLDIKKQADALSKIGVNLDSDMTETAAAVNEITANTQSIKGRIINQSASITQTNATMEQISANINKLNGHVEKQTASVAQS